MEKSSESRKLVNFKIIVVKVVKIQKIAGNLFKMKIIVEEAVKWEIAGKF